MPGEIMLKHHVNPVLDASGKPFPLSSAVAAGGFLFLSGQLGLKDGVIVQGGISAQTDAVIDNIESILKSEGISLRDIVKITVWLVRAADFAAFNEAYRTRLSDPYPARSTVVGELLLKDALVEVEVIAKTASK